ncbi:MerR family transcriptional regulator [Clostridioides difficile]
MKTITISQVSKNMGISTRMLRYYEQIGLIKSFRQEGYAYRVYDEEAISRIEQIMILRKLRIPVCQIQIILENKKAITAINIFHQNISELDEEITALYTIKDILFCFIKELVKVTELPFKNIISENDTLLSAIESLNIVSINFKEEQGMDKLNKADERLSKLNDIRIIYLPPTTVASAHYIGYDPELHVNTMLDEFVRKNNLNKIKPDLRHYGFNHPNPIDETGYHGYEAWVTIPENMEISAPLEKKQFVGGLYGAHMITFGNFAEWDAVLDWVNNSKKYEFAGDLQDQEHMCGLLEEHLNYFSYIENTDNEIKDIQLDLLIPIKEK